MENRAFYGLRRVLADLGEDETTDTRVLREVTGWRSEDTRKRYQKRRDKTVLRRAAETRHGVRQTLRGGTEESEKSDPAPNSVSFPDLSQLSLAELQELIREATRHLDDRS